MNEALFEKLPTEPHLSRIERGARTPEVGVNDTAEVSPLEYAATVLEHLTQCNAGVVGETQRCVDQIAGALGLTPLQMRQILEQTGALKVLQDTHQQMAAQVAALQQELKAEAGAPNSGVEPEQWN